MRKERAKEVGCDNAIKKTLAYRAAFNYPLSYHQLYNFLISDKKFEENLFDKELKKLVRQGEIGFKDGLYYDKKIRPVSWHRRYQDSKELLVKHKNTFNMLGKIPWIKLVGVTGSVAAYNADKGADIDLMVISKKNRLWLTRLFVAIMLKISNLYVRTDSEPGKFCPNIFISEEELEWPKDSQNIYTAHEVAIMQPVVDKNNSYFDFIKSNDWIKKYLPNIDIYKDTVNKKKDIKSHAFNFVEFLAQVIQLGYMKNKKTNEITTSKLIHFRKNDNSKWILENFNKTKK